MNFREVKAFIHRNRIAEVVDAKNRTAEAVALIRQHAKTGQPNAGWIYVTVLHASMPITE